MSSSSMKTQCALNLLLAASLAPGLAWGQRNLAGQELSSTLPPSVYVGLSAACPVVADEWWSSGEVRPVAVRGPCAIPAEAVAVVLDTQAQTLAGERLQVKVWAADQGEPEHTVLDGRAQAGPTRHRVTTLVNLCSSDICPEGDLNVFSSVSAQVSGWVVGYFQPVTLDDTGEASSGVVMPLSTESSGNNFFGNGAGASNTGIFNSFFGGSAGTTNSTGSYNAFFGYAAGQDNTTGIQNTFIGTQSGQGNTEGYGNVFIGYRTGSANSTGIQNTFIGTQAGSLNTMGSDNAFFGADAGYSNTTGIQNIFIGTQSGYYNTEGSNNAFVGYYAGNANTTGNSNAFFGADAGLANTTGVGNAFIGHQAGHANTTGGGNAFFGLGAGASNTIEGANTFIGFSANGVAGISNATALGYRAQVSQANSLVLGSIAGVNGATANVNVGIGTDRPARQLHLSGANAVFRMDRTADTAAFMLVRTDAGGNPLKTYVVGVNADGANNGEFVINDLGAAVGGGGTRRMTIDNDGNVIFTGTVSQASSARYKRDITTLTDASASLDRLRGVRFVRVATGRQELGLIAEEVAEVYPELVERDIATGQVEAVNYSALTAVLLQALKEQQARLENQQAEIADYRTRTAFLEGQVSELQEVKTRMANLEQRLEESLLPVVLTER